MVAGERSEKDYTVVPMTGITHAGCLARKRANTIIVPTPRNIRRRFRVALIREVSKTKATQQRGALIGLVYGESDADGTKHLVYSFF